MPEEDERLVCQYEGCTKQLEIRALCGGCDKPFCREHDSVHWRQVHEGSRSTATAPTASSYGRSNSATYAAGSTERVRLIAGIFGVIGWIVVAIGAIAIVVLLAQLGQLTRQFGPAAGGAGFLLAAVSLAGIVLSALGPFAAWAVLTALCDLHDQGERIHYAMSKRP
jgi:hypothetical protein